jgi:uncharacterized membrane protein
MAAVIQKTTIHAPADAVWATIADFNALPSYVESIVSSRADGDLPGSERTLVFGDGTEVVERLEELDDEAMTLTYSVVDGAVPLDDYLATIIVTPKGDDKCHIEWASTFDPAPGEEDVVDAMIKGVYQEAFAGLKRLHEEG